MDDDSEDEGADEELCEDEFYDNVELQIEKIAFILFFVPFPINNIFSWCLILRCLNNGSVDKCDGLFCGPRNNIIEHVLHLTLCFLLINFEVIPY